MASGPVGDTYSGNPEISANTGKKRKVTNSGFNDNNNDGNGDDDDPGGDEHDANKRRRVAYTAMLRVRMPRPQEQDQNMDQDMDQDMDWGTEEEEDESRGSEDGENEEEEEEEGEEGEEEEEREQVISFTVQPSFTIPLLHHGGNSTATGGEVDEAPNRVLEFHIMRAAAEAGSGEGEQSTTLTWRIDTNVNVHAEEEHREPDWVFFVGCEEDDIDDDNEDSHIDEENHSESGLGDDDGEDGDGSDDGQDNDLESNMDMEEEDDGGNGGTYMRPMLLRPDKGKTIEEEGRPAEPGPHIDMPEIFEVENGRRSDDNDRETAAVRETSWEENRLRWIEYGIIMRLMIMLLAISCLEVLRATGVICVPPPFHVRLSNQREVDAIHHGYDIQGDWNSKQWKASYIKWAYTLQTTVSKQGRKLRIRGLIYLASGLDENALLTLLEVGVRYLNTGCFVTRHMVFATPSTSGNNRDLRNGRVLV
ncbi:hypothetical protein HD806DRAFT_527322 [Xylariaceae sp. AK1471]|nr:hypothetical protein HD806DRAFT_527322 [Xylariaceae sp. AK1471]